MDKNKVVTTKSAAAGEPGPSRGSRVRNVYETLKKEILEMTLAPGEQLDETRLAARFSLSRTPVREAMVRLASERLVTTLPNRNSIVSTLDFSSASSYLDALTLMYRVTCRLAAARRSGDDIDEMRMSQTRYARAVTEFDAPRMSETNRQFHIAISRAAQNDYFTEFMTRLLYDGQRILTVYFMSLSDQPSRPYVDEHDAIIRAIEARDAEEADRLGATHAKGIVTELSEFLGSGVGQDIALGSNT